MPREDFPIKAGGGLNNKDASFDIRDNQSPDLLNVIFGNSESVETRLGAALLGDDTGSTKPTGMGVYVYDNGAGTKEYRLYRAHGVNIQRLTAGAWVNEGVVAVTAGVEIQFVQANNRLYLLNGVDAVWRLDNVTWTQLATGAPMSGANNIARYGWWDPKGVFYLGGTNANPDLIYASGDANGSLNTQEDFSGGYAVYVGRSGATGNLMGLIGLGNYTVAVKENGISMLSGENAARLSVVDVVTNFGCIAPRSISTDGQFVYFLGKDGHVHAFDTTRTWKLSDIISGTISTLNKSALSLSNGIYHKQRNQYLINVPYTGSSTPNHTLVIDLNRSIIQTEDYHTKVWTHFDGWNGGGWIEYSSANTVPDLIFWESRGDSKCYTAYTGTSDNGVAINSYYATKSFDFGDSQTHKQYKDFYVDVFQSGAWYLYLDYATEGTSTYASTNPSYIDLTPTGAVLPVTLPVVLDPGFLAPNNCVIIPVSSRYLSIKFSVNTLNQFFKIFKAVLYLRMAKRRRRISITS